MTETKQPPPSSNGGSRSLSASALPLSRASKKQATPVIKIEAEESPTSVRTAPRLPRPSLSQLPTTALSNIAPPNGTAQSKRGSMRPQNGKTIAPSLSLADIVDDDDYGWKHMGHQPTKATKRPRRESDGSNSPAYNQPVMDPYATPIRSKSPEGRNTSGVDACNAGGSGNASAASDSGKKRKRENPGTQNGVQARTTNGHEHNRRTLQPQKPKDESILSSRSSVQKLPTSPSPPGHHRSGSAGSEPRASLPPPHTTPAEPAAEDAPSDDLVGKVLLDRYRIYGVNGGGNFATCYKAFDMVEKKWVAIKRFFPQWSEIGTAEWHIVSDFKFSSRIVNATDCFWAEEDTTDAFYIVMEQLRSDTPIELPKCVCDENHAPIACPRRHRALAKIMVQLLSALAEVHESDVIHADLTPSNMLSTMDSGMGVKLIDFSNAVRKEGWAGYEEDYGVQTPCYRAPEILLGTGPVGKHIDIWSVGIIALQLLFGSDVFIPGGIEGGEIMRAPLEGRDAAVRRLIDIFGSVKSCEGGRYWLPDYISLSTRWGWEKGKGKVRLGEQAGVLGEYLARTQDVGLTTWIMGMVEVDWKRRSTVGDALRNPWLVDTLLGHFGRVLMRPGPSRVKVDHEEELRRRVKRSVTPEVRDFGVQASSPLLGSPAPVSHDKRRPDTWNSFSDDADDLDDQVNLVGGL